MCVMVMRAEQVRQHFDARDVEEHARAQAVEHADSDLVHVVLDADADADADRDAHREDQDAEGDLQLGAVRDDDQNTDREPLEHLVDDEHDEEHARRGVLLRDPERDAEDDGVHEDADLGDPQLDLGAEARLLLLVARDALHLLDAAHAPPVDLGGNEEDADEGDHREQMTEGIRMIVLVLFFMMIVRSSGDGGGFITVRRRIR